MHGMNLRLRQRLVACARMLACAASLGLVACAGVGVRDTAPEAWQSLLVTEAPLGWRNVGTSTLDPRWRVHDGVLELLAAGGGDIVSEAQFDDFELEWEWQLAPGGNSGVFYRAADTDPVWRRAPEYQLLDDARAEDRFVDSHRAGAVYDLVAPEGAVLAAADAFNRSRIVACGTRVEHWLNGVRVARYDSADDDWRRRVAASKFAGTPEFASARRGYIAIQDHGAPLRLRDLRIRALRGCGLSAG